MSANDNGTALVTGASGGIGAALSRRIASDGYDVVLTARRKERLDELAEEIEDHHGVATTVITKDLAEPNAPRELFEAVRDAGRHVHTLVNVAGFPVYGRFAETPIEEELEMMQVNMVALTHLTKLFVGPMIERGDGAVLNVAGLASYPPMPRLAVYAATKAYVRSFSEAIAHELADDGVQVTTLSPASVDTELYEKSEVGETSIADQDSMNDPASVAAAGWEGLKNGDRLVRPSMRAKLLPQVFRVLPESTITSMGAKATEKPQKSSDDGNRNR